MGRGQRFFEVGEVRLALLSLLDGGPRHGYQLMKEMEERSGGLYRASAGTVYPTLQQLQDEGLIEAERHSGKRVYAINELGRAEVERNRARVDRIWSRAAKWEDWGQWMGPHTATVAGPLVAVMKAALRAVAQAGDDGERHTRIGDILHRARHDLEDL